MDQLHQSLRAAKARFYLKRQEEACVRAERILCEQELQHLQYQWSGVMAHELVSDVLGLIAKNFTEARDMRAFRLTCTKWDQSFGDNTALYGLFYKSCWIASFGVVSFRYQLIHNSVGARNSSLNYQVDNYYDHSGKLFRLRAPDRWDISRLSENVWLSVARDNPLSVVRVDGDGNTHEILLSFCLSKLPTLTFFDIGYNKRRLQLAIVGDLESMWSSYDSTRSWDTIVGDITNLITRTETVHWDVNLSVSSNAELVKAATAWHAAIEAKKKSVRVSLATCCTFY